MYHIEKQRQADIAEHLRMSQATVSRMLKHAFEESIVRTTVVAPPGTFAALEAALRARFNLTEAIVLEGAEERDAEIMARIGEAAAHFLEATLQAAEVIGVLSWSKTILKMVDNLPPIKGSKAKYVVQTLGGMGAREIGMRLEDLAKVAALHGALNTGVIGVLVTDKLTACHLLERLGADTTSMAKGG